MFIFFYKWKTAYGMRIGDWSSDACASDLAVKSVLAERGRIDGLVNNAGGQYPMPLAAISKKGWDAVVASNLTGGFLMARETYTQWMQKNGGAIVNMIADMRSEEHTSELQSLMRISYAVFCLKKQTKAQHQQ